jgi:hypothetical protein
MSQVFLFSYDAAATPLHGLRRVFSKAGFKSAVPSGGSVAIKLHMGELGNIRYLRPVLVREAVDAVLGCGGRPFLFDTIVNYPSSRETKESYLDTAARNGFAEATMRAPVVIADDDDEMEIITVADRVDGTSLTEIKSPRSLLQSSFMVVLSHVKGHDLSGFGGAIKNLAMGCVSRESKRAQHSVNMPIFKNEAACDGCGKCAEACPTDAIEIIEGRPVRNDDECTYCCSCFFACPSGCWAWPPGAKEKIQVNMAHSARAVVSAFGGQIAYVNFIQDVAPHCDCAAPSGNALIQDVGIAASFDPVAIDKASLDLIDKAPVVAGALAVKPPDILGKLHNTDCLTQLRTAEKLGMGTMQYELITV